MNLFEKQLDDRAIAEAENELRLLLSSVPNEEGPPQTYWDTFATRVQTRVARGLQPAPKRAKIFWLPAMSMATIAAAAISFVLFRPVEVTLDQTTASLPIEALQTLQQSDATIVPTGTTDAIISSEFVAHAAKAKVDVDAALAFADTDPDQLNSAMHASSGFDQNNLDDLNDDDANSVIANLKTSL